MKKKKTLDKMLPISYELESCHELNYCCLATHHITTGLLVDTVSIQISLVLAKSMIIPSTPNGVLNHFLVINVC